MIASRLEPDTLSRAELDAHLARGWYRIGHSLITTDYLVSDGELRTTIWTRLDLQQHRFRSSLRKRMARNARSFRVTIGDLVLDAAHEDLYARYRAKVGGARAESLDEVLGGERGRALFVTREISVWSGEALAAFSWFDLGETSVESLIGVYDPAHARHGLGFWTLLLEVAHAAEIGMRFHYAGYVLSEPSGMDYKREVGDLEYLDPATQRWQRESPYPPHASPAEILRQRLGEAAQALGRSGATFTAFFNSALQIRGLIDQIPGCATAPILLVCTAAAHPFGVLTVWDLERACFALFSGRPIAVTLGGRDDDDAPTSSVDVRLFIIDEPLGEYASAEEVAFWVRHYLDALASPPQR